jgi:hypothetical protein
MTRRQLTRARLPHHLRSYLVAHPPPSPATRILVNLPGGDSKAFFVLIPYLRVLGPPRLPDSIVSPCAGSRFDCVSVCWIPIVELVGLGMCACLILVLVCVGEEDCDPFALDSVLPLDVGCVTWSSFFFGRHAVRGPAAGGRAGGSRGHQHRFLFS